MMRASVPAITVLLVAGMIAPATAGEPSSWFCQTGIIAPLEREVHGVDLVSADIRIRLPRPSDTYKDAHIRATYELENRYDKAASLAIAFPATGTGGLRVYLKINGEPVRSVFYASPCLLAQLEKTNILRWVEAHPEVAERIAQVPSRKTDAKAFDAAKGELEAWLDQKMGLSQADAHALVQLMLHDIPRGDMLYRVAGDRPWPSPLWAPYRSLREAINLRWRNQGLFVDPDSGRLAEYYDGVGSPGDTNLEQFTHTIAPEGRAVIVIDYKMPMGWDQLTTSNQLQFALAQTKYWGLGTRCRDEVRVEIEVPRGWRKVRIRPDMDLARTTSRSRIYRTSFTRPREDIYIALVP